MNEPLTLPHVGLFGFQPKDQTVSTPRESACTALNKTNIRHRRVLLAVRYI
jgi:hypothetical protein